MTDTKALKQKIEDSGYRLRFIADRLEISYQALLNKINNETEFKASEIQNICFLLKINREEKEKIFFSSVVD